MNESLDPRSELDKDIKILSDFMDYPSVVKIINKLTDFAEILTEGKITAIINFNYQLASNQTNQVLNFLTGIGALSRVYNMALKGSKNLDEEFVSNIFSDPVNPFNLSSYISLRNLLENRLSNEIQLYNMNMQKNNTTQAMPLNELKGHARTYVSLSKSEVSVSTKAQHGMISASLHDAYVILINRSDWRNDKTYLKYFFNDDDFKTDSLILERKRRISLSAIKDNIQYFLTKFAEIKSIKLDGAYSSADEGLLAKIARKEAEKALSIQNKAFIDKMLSTPFGRQYGSKIDSILSKIFMEKNDDLISEEDFQKKIKRLHDVYINDPHHSLSIPEDSYDTISCVEFLLEQEYTVKALAEKYFYGRKEAIGKFYTDTNKEMIETFLEELFKIFIEDKFNSVYRIIKSMDLKKYACAYIMKRIYLMYGENLTPFGYFLVKVIAKTGGIKTS